MYMKLYKAFFSMAAAVCMVLGLGGVVAYAQTASVSAPACLSLQTNLGYGSSDYYTSGAVTTLQNFLVQQGYFNNAYLGTGHFGSITLRAVQQFQASEGVPATGYVGALTRAAIARFGCGTTPIPTPTPTGAVSIYSVSPNVATVGSTVSVSGYGFTSANTILMSGLVAANVPISSSIAITCTTDPSCQGGIRQTLVFTVPSAIAPNCAANQACPQFLREVTPGQYAITIQNANGTSNAVTLTVTSGSTGVQPLSISGLDAPATLSLGQQGTWTVHVVAGSGSGNLHYSVVWGDEAYNNSIMAPQTTSVQSSATFTHVYQRSGTYTPVFTVTDDSGASVSASNTIVVQPLY